MFTKKGEGGMPLGVIITVVILVVAASVLIFITTDFGKKLIGLGQATPSALEAATQGCIIAARNNFVTDYCYNFRKVGNEMYVNCEDARIQSSLTQQGISTSGIACLKDNQKTDVLNICKTLTKSQRNSATFNGGVADFKCPAVIESASPLTE